MITGSITFENCSIGRFILVILGFTIESGCSCREAEVHQRGCSDTFWHFEGNSRVELRPYLV